MSNSSQYPQLPPSEPPPTAAHSNHGGTPAAWALVFVCGVGAVVAGIGMILASSPVILAGAIVVAAGIVLSVALRIMGKGQPPLVRTVGEDDELAHLRSPAPAEQSQVAQGAEAESEGLDR